MKFAVEAEDVASVVKSELACALAVWIDNISCSRTNQLSTSSQTLQCNSRCSHHKERSLCWKFRTEIWSGRQCALDASYCSSNRSSHNFVLLFNLIVTRAHDIMNRKENRLAAAVSSEDNTSLKGVLLKRIDFVGLDENALAHPNRAYYYRW